MSEFDMRLLLEKKKEEIDRLKEEYIMLQNASDEVEEEKDKEIERLNNIINEIDFYIYEKMRNIYIRADGDIGKYSFKALEEVWHKVRELKGRDKQ